MKVLALNNKGELTYCTVSPENRGRGRCNHVAHQNAGESPEEFVQRINYAQSEGAEEAEASSASQAREINQQEIDAMARQLDDIAGTHITVDNYRQVLNNLSADQIGRITEIAFEAAPQFSLPIREENYEDEVVKNKLYFANLPAYGISGNRDAIRQMFVAVGPTITPEGITDIEHSYRQGLTPDEYFTRQFSTRDAMINKSVSTAKPGYCIWEGTTVEVFDEDGNVVTMKWSDVEAGQTFTDGSVCTEVREWKYEPCIEIKLRDNLPVIVTFDHLISGGIYMGNLKIENLEASANARQKINESDPIWICAKDIYEFHQLGAHIDIGIEEIEYVRLFKNGTPVKVRCISTDVGYYEVNGITHHNTARKLFYCMSDTQVFEDCGGEHIDAMHCSFPEGHVCEKCARLTRGGHRAKAGMLIGGLISTNISEALTQLSMAQKHAGTLEVSNQQGQAGIIMATLDGWGTSPIIQKMRDSATTEEARQILYDGLKELYSNANIEQDDFNLQMVARKLTSYKRTSEGLRPVAPGEKCDVVSMAVVGNANNIFKTAELGTGYKHLTQPMRQELGIDAANQILN